MSLENEVKLLQEENNELSLAKTTILQASSIVDPIHQLEKTQAEMSLKEVELDKVKI